MIENELDYEKKLREIKAFVDQRLSKVEESKSHLFLEHDLSVSIDDITQYLKESTISRDYFNSIFNSVSDLLFVMTNDGVIRNANEAAIKMLPFDKGDFGDCSIEDLLFEGSVFSFESAKKRLIEIQEQNLGYEEEVLFKNRNGQQVLLHCSLNNLVSRQWGPDGYLVVARDLSDLKNTEQLVLKTILETQEQERKRLAKDLHDSLGQQISAIKFYLSTVAGDLQGAKTKKMVDKSIQALDVTITELRNICFDIMPATLDQFGFIQATQELCMKLVVHGRLDIIVDDGGLDDVELGIPKEKQVVLFRIVQELLNNSIKHSGANQIVINFNQDKDFLNIFFEDNGIGFDQSSSDVKKGMGLKNLKSRASTYGGKLQIDSEIGKGTRVRLKIPLH